MWLETCMIPVTASPARKLLAPDLQDPRLQHPHERVPSLKIDGRDAEAPRLQDPRLYGFTYIDGLLGLRGKPQFLK